MAKLVFALGPTHSLGPMRFEYAIKELSMPCVCKSFCLAFGRMAAAGVSMEDMLWFNRSLINAARGYSCRNTEQTLNLNVEK